MIHEGARKGWTESSKVLAESPFSSLYYMLIEAGVPVSAPEWLSFLELVRSKGFQEETQGSGDYLRLTIPLRNYARMALIKDVRYLATFEDVFEQFISKINTGSVATKVDLNERIPSKQLQIHSREFEDELLGPVSLAKPEATPPQPTIDSIPQVEEPVVPILKEQLNTQEVIPNQSPGSDHDGPESVHGGSQDQHNDILRREDPNKIGGGDQGVRPTAGGSLKVETPFKEFGYIPKPDRPVPSKEVMRRDVRKEFRNRPTREDVEKVARQLRRIVIESTNAPSSAIDVKGTVNNFSRAQREVVYQREHYKRPRVVMFVDVGGPVDTWSPILAELMNGVTSGIADLKVYCFHNNLYGYAWRPSDPSNLPASGEPHPETLVRVRDVISSESKVIIYGDADMADGEFDSDAYIPKGCETQVKSFSIGGEVCLGQIKRRANSVVWVRYILTGSAPP